MVPGSIPGVTGDFFRGTPKEPCARRSTQPLEMSTRDFSWGKGGRCVWLTTYHPCSAETSRKSGAFPYLEPTGPPRPVAGHLTFTSSENKTPRRWCKYIETCRSTYNIKIHCKYIYIYTGCLRRNVPDFGRLFLMLNCTDITQNTYVQIWLVTEIMARECWNFDSCYTLIDYQIHIKTGRNMWFL